MVSPVKPPVAHNPLSFSKGALHMTPSTNPPHTSKKRMRRQRSTGEPENLLQNHKVKQEMEGNYNNGDHVKITLEQQSMEQEEKEIEEAATKPQQFNFKQFDVVTGDSSDHHYANYSNNNHSKASKKIMQEWKILEKNLPESIFVRAYEHRIDLLRAVIIGSSGTPYHNSLFFFDFYFPIDYPARPPEVNYRAHGLRVNPNLYANGRVCLSLLNTWTGKKNEKWDASRSTVLQVLVSLQALVLNEKPYFNEPINGALPGKQYWEKKSVGYNEDVFVLCCKSMLFVMGKPPMHFEDFVGEHFRDRGEAVLVACKAYMDGRAKVGDLVEVNSTAQIAVSKKFKASMDVLYPRLVKAFVRNGCCSLGNFVEHLQAEKKEGENKARLVQKEKGGLKKVVLSKVKSVLRLNKIGSTKHESKKNSS